MFNSVTGYGGTRPAALQNASGPSALSKTNHVQKTDVSTQATQAEEVKKTAPVDKAAVRDAVKKLNETVAPALQTLQFEMDEDSDKLVVKVVDKESKEVIRQMPSEEALAFSKTIDKLQGLVIRQTA
jgi:flagellar protein FlaG